MNLPHVLVFLDWYRPGFKAGGPVRSMVNLVDRLRGRVIFHIVTGDTDYRSPTPHSGITTDRWMELPTGEFVHYTSTKGRSVARWRALLTEQAWDAVYINGIYSWWYSILPAWLCSRRGINTLVAVRGMLAHGPMLHGAAKKKAFLTLARMLGLYRSLRFHATTQGEAEEVRRWIGPEAVVGVVPNLPRVRVATSAALRTKVPGTLRIVSLARIAIEKNTHLALECLRPLRGQVQFDLYGTVSDGSYWARCEAIISGLPANVQVRYHGAADPDRVPDLLAEAHVLFMPSAGENFGHAMFEALSEGVPILVSDRTPWRDLMANQAGWDLPLDRPERFSEVLQSLVDMDQAAYEVFNRGAFDLAGRYLAGQDAETSMLALLVP